jgi:hypothetical protein
MISDPRLILKAKAEHAYATADAMLEARKR